MGAVADVAEMVDAVASEAGLGATAVMAVPAVVMAVEVGAVSA